MMSVITKSAFRNGSDSRLMTDGGLEAVNMETKDSGHTWGARPSDFLQADLHNLSADSGLSHSPIQQEAPRLTIGRRIGHIDQPGPDTQAKEKGSRWSLGGLFKKRSSLKSSESHSEPKERNASHQAGSPGPPLPPKNSNVFQPTMQVRPRPGQHHPVIFPQLQADLQYPEPGTQIVHGGHYYDPRWGYVRTGSYYDSQIAAMTGHERVSRQSTMSQDRSSGVHSMTRSSVHSLGRTDGSLRSELSDRSHDSGDTMRSWRDQKHDILRQAEVRRSLIVAEAETSESEEESEVRVIRRAGSVGSLGRRGRGSVVRGQRRECREEGGLVTSSPYVHTGHIMGHRSMSADISHASTPPPAPPPRDPNHRHHLMSARRGGGRPVSYSFEHLRSGAGDRPSPGHDMQPPPPGHQPRHKSQSPVRATLNQLALPHQRPQYPDLSLKSPAPGPMVVHSSPVHHRNNPEAASLHNIVADQLPRSRRPLHYQAVTRANPGSAASSEGIGSQTSLEDTGGHQPQSSEASDRMCVGNGHSERLDVRNGISRASDNNMPAKSARSRLRSGKCSPASVNSKDSGCSASSDVQASVPKPPVTASGQVTSSNAAGFSTQKRRSRFEEAIKELELVYNNIADDEDLLDRAERRDLPTAHQLLIWRDQEEQSSHNTSAESAMSDFDNFLNWNTSSSFEHVSGLVSPISSRPRRRGGVSDKFSDDMMVRRISAANKIPVTQSTMTCLGNTSYLSVSSALDITEETGASEWEPEADEPDIRVDDVLNRNLRDANQIRVIQEPQPKFGFPLGPVTGGVNSDYLHAVPDGKYRSTFNPMRNPDLVKDDLAFRHLRKDESLDDPSGLGIVKDPHGLISSAGTHWPPWSTQRSPSPQRLSDNHNQITRSLSENIAQIIRKQSSKPGAKLDEIITYEDLSHTLVYDTIKYTMDLINKRKNRPDKAISKSPAKLSPTEKQGITMYELFRHHQSEPESINTLDAEKEVTDANREEEDEGVSSVSSPDPCVGSQLPDLVTGERPYAVSVSSRELSQVANVRL